MVIWVLNTGVLGVEEVPGVTLGADSEDVSLAAVVGESLADLSVVLVGLEKAVEEVFVIL